MSTETTLTRHLYAVSNADLDAIMSDYTEESVLFTQQGRFQGLEELRRFFEDFLKNTIYGQRANFALIRQNVVGEAASIIWNAKPYVILASDTFVIRNEKILLQSLVILQLSVFPEDKSLAQLFISPTDNIDQIQYQASQCAV